MGVNLCYNCRTFKHEVTEKTSSELVELLLQQPTARVIFRSTCTFRVESLMEVYWISSPIIAAVLIWNCLVWYYSSTDELIMSCEIPNLPSLNTRLLYLFTVIFKTITIITWGIYIIQRPCTGFQSNTSNIHTGTRRWLHLCGHFPMVKHWNCINYFRNKNRNSTVLSSTTGRCSRCSLPVPCVSCVMIHDG